MCCNTKAGPRAAIAFFKKKTGIHVTQADWHKIRKAAEVSLGRPLTNKVADSHLAATVAADFADSLAATPEEKKAIIEELAGTRTTEGNIEAVRELSENGLPASVRNKKSRISPAQRAEMAAADANSESPVPWGEPQEKSMWQKAQIKLVGVSNYPAVSKVKEDFPVYIEHEPDNPHDPNAMKVIGYDGETLGYLPRLVAERVLNETGERAFTGHIAATTHHDGNTVGGAIMLDTAVPHGYFKGMEEMSEFMSEDGLNDIDNYPDNP